MLKNLRFSGIYHDENLSVHVMLENPADYGIKASSLVLSVAVKDKNGDKPKMEDFDFHVMDEAGLLYSAMNLAVPSVEAEDGEPVYCPDWLIVTDFRHEFLFQDLRVAFRYKPYEINNANQGLKPKKRTGNSSKNESR